MYRPAFISYTLSIGTIDVGSAMWSRSFFYVKLFLLPSKDLGLQRSYTSIATKITAARISEVTIRNNSIYQHTSIYNPFYRNLGWL